MRISALEKMQWTQGTKLSGDRPLPCINPSPYPIKNCIFHCSFTYTKGLKFSSIQQFKGAEGVH